MTLRSALLAATVLAFPLAVAAQPVSGLYVAGGLGANILTSTKITSSFGSGHVSEANVGWAGFASLGFGYGDGLRTELELLGLYSNLRAHASGVTGGVHNGTYGAMINGLYDFNVGLPATPYLGLGVGYVGTQVSDVNATAGGANVAVKSGMLGSFAAQAIAGLSIPVAPQLDATLEYRLVDKLQNRYTGGHTTFAGTDFPGNVKVGSEVNHGVYLGLRYAFGAAPAAAAPAPAPVAAVAPAPAPARSYLVFFDWDKADLTARAQQIIAEAARNATKVGSTRIDVAGHADRTGTEAYNMALSLRRANNVAAELVRLGVAKTEIGITAYGDTKPLVPTAPGVREPQNRRVEIVLK